MKRETLSNANVNVIQQSIQMKSFFAFVSRVLNDRMDLQLQLFYSRLNWMLSSQPKVELDIHFVVVVAAVSFLNIYLSTRHCNLSLVLICCFFVREFQLHFNASAHRETRNGNVHFIDLYPFFTHSVLQHLYFSSVSFQTLELEFIIKSHSTWNEVERLLWGFLTVFFKWNFHLTANMHWTGAFNNSIKFTS